MLKQDQKQKVRFGPFDVDFANGEIRKLGVRLRVQGKPLSVLQILVENAGEIVSRETLRSRLWVENNVFVDFDKGLSTAVNKLRETLSDCADRPRYIETIPKRGYRFIATIETEELRPGNEVPLPAPVENGIAARTRVFFWARSKWAAVVLFLIVILGMCLGWAAFGARRSGSEAPTIAVLPFTDRSPDKNQLYFSEGLSDEIVTNLGRIPGLRVIGRNSSFILKADGADPREIKRKLGVMYLVEGSVVKVGDRVRIQAELVNTSDGFQIWTDSYETRVDDALRVEDEISRAVASALSNRLLGFHTRPLASSPTVNPEAYQAYLQAKYFKGRWIVSELNASLSFLNRSLEIDPGFAPAWALRSSVLAAMGDMGELPRSEAKQRSRQDAEKAVQLDGDLPEALVALSTVQIDEWNWKSAEISLDKAYQSAPRDPEVLFARSQLYRMLGRLPECIATLQKVTILDPLSPGAYGSLGNRFYFLGRYKEALEMQERTLQLNPQAEFVHLNRGEVYIALRKPEEALTEIQKEPGELWRSLGLAIVYPDLGRVKEADTAVRNFVARYGDKEPYLVAEIYAHRNQVDNAFGWLERAFAQRDSSLVDIKNDPLLNNLRHDSRYANLVRRMGLSEY